MPRAWTCNVPCTKTCAATFAITRNNGACAPDTNIDHRRVLNLMTYFERLNLDLPVSDDADDYLPGDVVAWKLNDKQYHIGVVMQERSYDEQRPLIGHNINAGVVLQDVLFDWEIVGQYRYFPSTPATTGRNRSGSGRLINLQESPADLR
ncbi:MAG: DUF1287 domain-containing protein [Thiolinea sp.]